MPRVLLRSLASRGYRGVSQATGKQLAEMIRDTLESPMSSSSGGRPRAEAAVVDCTVVVQEARADGSPHFHAVVKLFRQMRFKLAKETLQERHRLPSHWSSSHSQLWSAICHIHVATPS